MLELVPEDLDRRPKPVGENTIFLYIFYTCKYYVPNLNYIPAYGMNNIKFPGSRFCESDNKPWDCTQHCNFLPGCSMTGCAQRCTKV